jgi:hypothetical protein
MPSSICRSTTSRGRGLLGGNLVQLRGVTAYAGHCLRDARIAGRHEGPASP